MCRLAAFPPGFKRNDALDILANFEGCNTDGTGSSYVKDGKFVVDKWPTAFNKVIKSKPFLAHMPYNGWTVAHLRAASHGDNVKQNTHPFNVGPWSFIHNGIWTEHNLVRLALSKQVQMEGETDSEVAAHLWNIIGPKKFAEAIDFSGVFMGLHKTGELWVVKTSGDLEIKALSKEQVVMASEFDKQKYEDTVEALFGWYHFAPDGTYIKHKETRESWSRGYPYTGSYVSSGGGGLFASKSRVHAGFSRVDTTATDIEDWRNEESISNDDRALRRYCE